MSERAREVTRLLHLSADYRDPNPGRSHITGLDHALRCAALGDDDEAAFLGLVHDLARPLNDVHHGEIMAWIVRDRVSDTGYHILRTHGQYQSAIIHGHDLPDHPWQRDAARFAGHEARSFQAECPAISGAQAEWMLEWWLS